MRIIDTENRKEMIKILKGQGDLVVAVTQETIFSFPKNLYPHRTQKSFLEFFKENIKRHTFYEVNGSSIIKKVKVK